MAQNDTLTKKSTPFWAAHTYIAPTWEYPWRIIALIPFAFLCFLFFVLFCFCLFVCLFVVFFLLNLLNKTTGQCETYRSSLF